jgi:hypothetical protein
LKALSGLKIRLEGSLQVYVGKTTVVSALDVTAIKSTESPVKGLDVNAVNIPSMISPGDGLTRSGLVVETGFGLLLTRQQKT